MVTTVNTETLLSALRERLEPLFDQYAYLEYVVVMKTYGDVGELNDLMIVKFEGEEEAILDFSEPSHCKHLSSSERFLFLLYQKYRKIKLFASEAEETLFRKRYGMLIHREPEKCKVWNGKTPSSH